MIETKHRDSLVCRIISGKLRFVINDKVYILDHPNRDIRLESQDIYDRVLQECLFTNWLTDKRAVRFLIANQLWSVNGDKNLEQIVHAIEDIKVDLFKAAFNVGRCQKLRERLFKTKDKYQQMLETRHSLDYVTAHGYAESIKNQFIILSTLYDDKGKLVCRDPHLMNYNFFAYVLDAISEHLLSATIYRELARTEPWRSYWVISEGKPFDRSPVEWTDDQKSLVLFSKMYDNAYQHPNCPDDNIIQDDDKFDGWLIHNKREREKERSARRIEQQHSKYGKANEIFVVAGTQEEAKEINDMNTFEAKLTKKRRELAIAQKGVVKEWQMPDVQDKVHIEQQRALRDRFKPKKKGQT